MSAKYPAPWQTEQAVGLAVVIVCLTLQSSLRFFDGLQDVFAVLVHGIASPPQNQVTAMPNTSGTVFGMTSVVIACIVYVLPSFSAVGATVLALGLVSGLLLAELLALMTWGLNLPLTFPAMLLVAAFSAQCVFRALHPAKELPSSQAQPVPSQRMMALALQGQGQLDMAFEHFQRTAINDTVAADLYCLAQAYEGQRQFDNATRVYRYIASSMPDFKDVKERQASTPQAVRVEPVTASLPAAGGGVAPVSKRPEGAGKYLGRYQIDRPLGKGAMGLVYLGLDSTIGRQVALKTMSLSQEFDGLELVDARERFFREAKAAGRLQHPTIVTIFDVGEENGVAYIAMEYVAGQDLQAFCKAGALMPVHEVLSIVMRVALALDYAHRQQVIHRDIKPGNVMYDRASDTVKVTDFGIARITDGSKTKTGVVLGSPSYMAPEQLAGRALDGRSDLYALGVMLFQLLTGTLPFRAGSLAELMAKIARQVAPDVRQSRSDIPEDLARIVARLLEKLPQSRYLTGESLAHDLLLVAERVQSQENRVRNASPLGVKAGVSAAIDLEV